jgi:hypothetical protein
MPLRRQEIRDFIKACEQIQALVAQGTRLTADEKELIQSCMDDLVGTMRTSATAA